MTIFAARMKEAYHFCVLDGHCTEQWIRLVRLKFSSYFARYVVVFCLFTVEALVEQTTVQSSAQWFYSFQFIFILRILAINC